MSVTDAQQYWWLAPLISFCAFVVSLLALGAIVWFNWGQHRVRAIKLKRPFNAFLTYGPSDPYEYWDLHVPAHSKVMVQVRIRPRMQYRQTEIVFGFNGDPVTRPVPLQVLNRFIKKGMNRKQDPDTTPNHYIDNDNHYHIVTTVDRSPPNTQALEFIVQTKKPGHYPVLLEVITDSGEAKPKNDLDITVVERLVPDAHLATQETSDGDN